MVYSGTAAQAVGGMAYHHVSFANGGQKTLSSAASAAGSMTIDAGIVFRIDATGSLQLTGEVLNDGTFLNDGVVTSP